ncbi:MAG: site-specific integrase [Woeseiaceae bacterium]
MSNHGKTKYPGIRVRGKKIFIDFRYKGVRCRESLKLDVSNPNIKIANRIREAILMDILLNKLNYADYFPESKLLVKFGNKPKTKMTITEGLDWWWENYKNNARRKTLLAYGYDIKNHIKPGIGKIYLDEISPRQIRSWIDSIDLSNKSKNNILIPLKNMFNEAKVEKIITENPMLDFKSYKIAKKDPAVFTPTQIDNILSNFNNELLWFYTFSFWTGLSTGEQIGLQWGDIDFESNAFFIRRSISSGKFIEETKNDVRWRKVELLSPAIEALTKLKPRNFDSNPEKYNSTYVFQNPRTKDHWRIDPLTNAWKEALKKAEVKYIRPYNTRHTFASIMLSAGLPASWIRQQMGHVSLKMLEQVYARWIDGDTSVLEWVKLNTINKNNGTKFTEFFVQKYV